MIEFLKGINPRFLFLTISVALLGFLIYRDRENVQRESILFYRRTDKGLDLIDKIAKRFPRFWNFYGWTGLVVGIMTIPFIVFNIVLSFSQMFQSGGTTGGPSLVAPGLSAETTFQSGISFIPVEYWVLGIGVLMIVHEMSHGIVARAEDMELNSVGWIVLGIIPGAFVEPKGENMLPEKGDKEENKDEEIDDDDGSEASSGHWDQGSLSSQLKVLAAGSFANYITALVLTGLALLLFVNITAPSGVSYLAQDNLSASEAGMTNGTLYSIDDQKLRYGSEVKEALQNYEVNDTILANTSEGSYNVTLMERNGSAHMGVLIYTSEGLLGDFIDMINNNREIKDQYSSYEGFLSWTLSGLQVIALLNLLIGLFNMLPVRPLDGGQIVAALTDKYWEDSTEVFNYLSVFVWILLLGSVALSIVSGL